MKTITVVAATGLRIDGHATAIERTAANIPREVRKLLLSPTPPTVPFTGEWRALPRWMPNGRWELSDYCRFLILGLAEEITTDVCISVHWDGYGVNADRWTEEFLEYDYIGAPWPPWLTSVPGRRVGNGGFSLRSRRWLEAGASGPPFRGEPEDVFCCQTHLDHWLARGCKVAPLELALRWSIEHGNPEHPVWPTRQSFGFHGWFNPDREQYRI